MLRVVRKQYAQRALGAARQMSSNSTSPGTAVTEVVHPAHQREPLPAEVISGAPSSLTKRTVRIYRPSNNPMQSGKNANLKWRLDFDALEKGDRWENPLMGWQSTADPMSPVRLDFTTKEDAIHFAEKQGWSHYVQEPQFRAIKPKSYKHNFVYRPGKIPMVHTK
ncbi:ndufs4 NADH dehydrogenase Fe-S protein subunit [Coemansia sp. RSA 376]|nr:ndufs4 NADH dehydrogenase Fe-S protein subunit [Coemansia sp. S680]KAJ2040828.1 ndufs4 NADH dehydrogenase Fe-S protein subunit [Coemansia sp. S3946]KAJ2042373.1 ndufs4 NADH dehydrogenase Fe-S protein subunit [Coemansia sp. S155-1]KAJ2046687.1 ndufs4 NADH dehydrogenase Fe-S protein subunit [Coemansia sp. S2]KAJ2114818.1 ndufs4 NADH dehydrogenase Fe-S protein subunit [Coemansia sp. RSA 922]KAJ2260178.1 ndufs4 NADH dehydrogenase Fe-S protein subunit [Coemansia sp. RSA 376]KAJ2353244.1 ndufs4 